MTDSSIDLKQLFPSAIIKVTAHDLIESKDSGDEEQQQNQRSKQNLEVLENIIDSLGEGSAMAQGLRMPITTAEKLKNAENHNVYLMADFDPDENGTPVGLLKVAKKDLFLYDELKQQRKVKEVPCILDFYIHENYQRCGFGKKLFEKMLKEENWTPVKCSIDRPSEKLRGFLRKHYGLEDVIPQGYKFVLYKGFFDDRTEKEEASEPSRTLRSLRRCAIDNIVSKEPPFMAAMRAATDFKSRRSSICLEHFGGCNVSAVCKIGFNDRHNRKQTNLII